MMRIGALLRRTDMELLDRWYLAAGTALHVDGRKPHRPEVAEALLVELGLDPALVAEAIEDPTTGDEVLAEHQQVLDAGRLGRADAGVRRRRRRPPGAVRAGPDRPAHAATTPSRSGTRSTAWLRSPHLYELQRPKRPADIAAIAQAFEPYLTARDWITIQKETP